MFRFWWIVFLVQRQLFAVYLHNDKSISVNIFVGQVLQNQLLIDQLQDSVVFWPWDVTLPESRMAIQTDLMEIVGQHAVHFMGTRVDVFPIILLCGKSKGSVEVLRVVDGTKSAQEVLTAVELAQDMHRRNQEAELSDQVIIIEQWGVILIRGHPKMTSTGGGGSWRFNIGGRGLKP